MIKLPTLRNICNSAIGFTFVFFSCSLKTKELRCNQFRNGNFVFHFRNQNNEITFLIKRKDSLQTETDKISGFYSKLLVKWTNECYYETLLLETNFPFSDSIQNIRKTIPLKTEIINTTNKYYVFKSQRGNSTVMRDTMWVVK